MNVTELSKERVFFHDMVKFTWTIDWQGGSHSTVQHLCVKSVLNNNRCFIMPPGWRPAINALKAADDARDNLQRSLPLDVCKLECKLLGLPKRFDLPRYDLSPGACVALVDNGCRVNYVLIAHIDGDVWCCSPGATMKDGCILLNTVWMPDCCKTKNIVKDAWSDLVLKRRMGAHIMVQHLHQLLHEHTDAFFGLVAQKSWLIEEERVKNTKHNFDVVAASSFFESNPFMWENGFTHQQLTDIHFLWSWECKGEVQLSKQTTCSRYCIYGDVSLPNELFTDMALFERLLRRAKRETEQTYCTCTYLGVHAGLNKFEPDPSRWHDGGYKSKQQIWVEYKHIRNGETNRAYRVQVRVNNWLSRADRTPGNPLYTTSSRTLRFSIEFMDAFAQNRMDGMIFLGVCYDNPDRPDVIRQLPNDIDIQNKHGATATSSGHLLNLSDN